MQASKNQFIMAYFHKKCRPLLGGGFPPDQLGAKWGFALDPHWMPVTLRQL